MYIGHVSDCYLPRLGGIEWQVHDLAARQSDAGHRVEIVTAVSGECDPGGVLVHRPRGDGGSEAVRYRRAHSGSRCAVSRGFDVLHVHASTFSPLAFSTLGAATRAGIPTVVTLHSMLSYATSLHRAGHRVTGWGRRSAQWTAVSSAAAAPLQAMLPAGVTVGVLPNGVDRDQWLLPETPDDAGCSGTDREVHVVSSMRFTHRKRPMALVSMLAQARAALAGRVRLRATIVGDGPMRAQVARALRRAGLADCVDLPGRLERPAIAELYSRADIYVAPAELESFGIAALEARCAGLPVLGRTGTGLVDFIAHGVEGLLADDDQRLAAHLIALAGDPVLRTAMSGHNRAQPPSVTWPDIVRSCDKTYGRALAGVGRSLMPLSTRDDIRLPATMAL